VPRLTQVPYGRVFDFAYGTITLYGWPFHADPAIKNFFDFTMYGPTTPMSMLIGLGWSPFARHY
jgi:hypothetical protein